MKKFITLLFFTLAGTGMGEEILVRYYAHGGGQGPQFTSFLAQEKELPSKTIWGPGGSKKLPLTYTEAISIARKAAARENLPDFENIPVTASLNVINYNWDRIYKHFPKRACPYFYLVRFDSPLYPIYTAHEEIFLVFLNGKVARKEGETNTKD